MIEYAHEVHGIKTFVLNHAVDNSTSGIVAQKCGLSYEGTRRELFKDSHGEIHDIS